MRVYLAGGINGLSDAACNDWRAEAKRSLECDTLDPMRRDYRGKEDDSGWKIVLGDLWDIFRSNTVIVNAERPSWGTAMEIIWAWLFGCYLVAFTGGPRVSPWLRFWTDEVVDSLPAAVAAVKERGPTGAGRWVALYVVTIVAVNWSWANVPPIWGGVTAGSIAVGFLFLVRDAAQGEVGHRRIWGAMVLGAFLSALGAPWRIAAASFGAFIVAEGIDWAVFTYLKRPKIERMVWSSAAGVPVDSLIFLLGAGYFTAAGFAVMVACKFVAVAALVALWFPRRTLEVSP
jgi:uncharacterized PurR-regulated membrane protein YhhQ (DUF165 family)